MLPWAAMSESRNVIVFAIGKDKFAFEIRWVKEVITLGFVTTVPSAPAILCGVCNWHGQIVPVIDITESHPARQGDGAMVIDVANSTLAFCLEKIDRVASLPYENGRLTDGSGNSIPLLDPEQLHQTISARTAQTLGADQSAGIG
jgi:chemotaxis signal transduction protein